MDEGDRDVCIEEINHTFNHNELKIIKEIIARTVLESFLQASDKLD